MTSYARERDNRADGRERGARIVGMSTMQESLGTKPPFLSAAENVATARAMYDAVEAKDRSAAERLIAEDFRFFSPQDNGLDRDRYFEICWPQAERFQDFKLTDAIADGERVFVTYEAVLQDGDRFRNAEVLTVRNGRISAVEVYFGWIVPHPVAEGEHDEHAA
jgi:ketosteroid isomerase-like protein